MSRLTLSILLVACLVTAAVAEPLLVAPAPRFDFGITPQDATLTHHFWLKSIGEDTVRIGDVKTGCSCAISDLDTKVVPPGDSVLVGFAWDIKRLLGGIHRSPMIYYNDKPDPLRVHMSGSVSTFPDSARPVALQPYRVVLGRAGTHDVDSLEFELRNFGEQDLGVELISLVPEQVDLFVPEVVPAGGDAAGYVRVKPDFKDEEFTVSVTFLVNDRASTHLTLPIVRKFY